MFFVCASALEAKLEANENVLAVESQSKRHDLALRAKEMQGAGCAPSLADLDLKFHLDHGPCGSVPIAPARIKAVAAICSFDFAAEVSADAICSCQCWCSVPAERQNSAGGPLCICHRVKRQPAQGRLA